MNVEDLRIYKLWKQGNPQKQLKVEDLSDIIEDLRTVLNNSSNTKITNPGNILTFDVGTNDINVIDPPNDQNSVLYGDPFLEKGMKWKPFNMLPNLIYEESVFTHYVINTGIQYFDLNFDGLSTDVNINLPPINENVISFIMRVRKPLGPQIQILPDPSDTIDNYDRISTTTKEINIIFIPLIAQNKWLTVKLFES